MEGKGGISAKTGSVKMANIYDMECWETGEKTLQIPLSKQSKKGISAF